MASYRVIGISSDRSQAQRAYQQLGQRGFPAETISIMYLSPGELEEAEGRQEVAKGAAVGGATGGTIGAIAGLATVAIPGIGPVLAAGILGTAMAGTAVGGVLGAWSQIGLEDDLAEQYNRGLQSGDTVLAIDVPDPDDAATAEHIMRDQQLSLVNTFQI